MGNRASMQPPATDRALRRFAQPQDLEAFGARLAPRLAIGEAVCLTGPLGAGKSTLARGLVRAFVGSEIEVPSPTFTLMQLYEGPAFPLAHFDLYRLARPEEAFEIGLDEALDVGAAVIEWSERLGDALPPDRLEIALTMNENDTDGRRASVRGLGAWRTKAAELG